MPIGSQTRLAYAETWICYFYDFCRILHKLTHFNPGPKNYRDTAQHNFEIKIKADEVQTSSSEPIAMVGNDISLWSSEYSSLPNPPKTPSKLIKNLLFHVLVGVNLKPTNTWFIFLSIQIISSLRHRFVILRLYVKLSSKLDDFTFNNYF